MLLYIHITITDTICLTFYKSNKYCMILHNDYKDFEYKTSLQYVKTLLF